MSKHKIISIATLLGLAMWLADATLEWLERYFLNHPKNFIDLLIYGISLEELIIRSLTLFSFIAFGFCIDRYIAKVEDSEEKLKQSEQQLRVLAAQLLNIQENERTRVAKELHDELGQSLMLLKFQLSAIHEKIKNKSSQHELLLVLEYLDGVIENVRRLTKELSPTLLENLGLSAAIEFLVEDFSKSLNIESSADIEDVDPLLSPQVQLNIYRIFQEALTNIGRHAQARHLTSVMKRQDDHIYLEIGDDGKGFDVKSILASSHNARKFGLTTMNERVQLIRGTLELQSRMGSGTKIIITVPVGAGEEDGPSSYFAGR